MTTRLLLLSNSTNFGRGYLDHAIDAVRAFFRPARRIAFVPYALHDREGYTAKVAERLAREGFELTGLPASPDACEALRAAEAVFVGGGNTFRLLKTLQETRLLSELGERVLAGMPYMGASAGTNIAAPTVRTTNDMPIVEPAGLAALSLVPFQINPHYIDADAASPHMGETRETRLREFLEENDRVVVGLREGSWLRIEGSHGWLEGGQGARIFRRGAEPEERAPGTAIDDLLKG